MGRPRSDFISITAMRKRSVADLRAQAVAYRRMAKPARMLNIRDALMKIAARYDALADQRDQERIRGKLRQRGAPSSG